VDEPLDAAAMSAHVTPEVTVVAASGAEAAALAAQGPAVLVAPATSSGGPAAELLAAALRREPSAQLVVTAAPEDLAAAVALLRAGASDVLVRPVAPAALAASARAALERARARRVLSEAARLASLGAVVGGVVHQINNPITSLVASARYVADGLAELDRLEELCAAPSPAALRSWWWGEGRRGVDELKAAAADAIESGERIRELARDLGAVARGGSAAPFDLGEAVRAAIRLAGAEVLRAADVELDLAPGTLVNGYMGQLTLCFVQLLASAAQAFSGAGRRGQIRIAVRAEHDRAVAEVSDDAPAPPPEELERIFEPFGCPRGGRPGPGLSLCRDTVVRHRGEIEARSGTTGQTVTLRLPAASPGER
jgi:signal transduction histidine kinase